MFECYAVWFTQWFISLFNLFVCVRPSPLNSSLSHRCSAPSNWQFPTQKYTHKSSYGCFTYTLCMQCLLDREKNCVVCSDAFDPCFKDFSCNLGLVDKHPELYITASERESFEALEKISTENTETQAQAQTNIYTCTFISPVHLGKIYNHDYSEKDWEHPYFTRAAWF